jgi:hypothetical protein
MKVKTGGSCRKGTVVFVMALEGDCHVQLDMSLD